MQVVEVVLQVETLCQAERGIDIRDVTGHMFDLCDELGLRVQCQVVAPVPIPKHHLATILEATELLEVLEPAAALPVPIREERLQD